MRTRIVLVGTFLSITLGVGLAMINSWSSSGTSIAGPVNPWVDVQSSSGVINAAGAFGPTPTPTATPTATATPRRAAFPTHTPVPRPDLVALSMAVEPETVGSCISKLGVRIFFSNEGDVDASPFVVTVNDVQQAVDGLPQGELATLWFNGYDAGFNFLWVDSLREVVESDETNNGLFGLLSVPTQPPTCTPAPVGPTPVPNGGDTDGDGCSDQRENLPKSEAAQGGGRDWQNPWDFYDINGDGIIDLFNDILGVINHYSLDDSPPYDVNFDRGPSAGPNPWNMTAPDGSIDLFTDILGVIQQHGHDCR